MIKYRMKKLTVFLLAFTMMLSFFPALTAEAKNNDDMTVTFNIKTTADGTAVQTAVIKIAPRKEYNYYYDYEYDSLSDGSALDLHKNTFWHIYAPTISGYEFDHWDLTNIDFKFQTDETDKYADIKLDNDSNGNVTAYYKLSSHALSVSTYTDVYYNGSYYGNYNSIHSQFNGGKVNGSYGIQVSYTGEDSIPPLNAQAESGYVFDGWYVYNSNDYWNYWGYLDDFDDDDWADWHDWDNWNYYDDIWEFYSFANPLSLQPLSEDLSLVAYFRTKRTVTYTPATGFTESGTGTKTTFNSVALSLTGANFDNSLYGDYTITFPAGVTASLSYTNSTSATLSLKWKDGYTDLGVNPKVTLILKKTAFSDNKPLDGSDANGSYTIQIPINLPSRTPVNLTYSGNAFYESAANDGSIGSTIVVTSDTADFKSSITASDYTLSGTLPGGLSLSVSRSAGNSKQAVISLTGKAASHSSANSASGLTLAFNNTAFSTAISTVTNKSLPFSVNFNDPLGITTDGSIFTESDMNDGTVAGTRALLLSGSSSFADTEFISGTQYDITGVPAGLSAVVTRDSGKRLQLYFKGKAENHTGTANIQLVLKNAAFTGNSSEGITGLTQNFTIFFHDKKPVRVLEVYPSIITGTYGDFKEAAAKLTGSAQYNYIVTSMSLNEFISKTDEVNGNYDAVYFGRGTYGCGGVNEVKYGNDITNLAAGRVINFINSGQTAIFSSDVFTNDTIDTIIKTSFNAYKTGKISTGADKIKSTLEAAYASANKRPVLDMIAYPYSYRDNDTPYDSNLLKFTYRASDPDGEKVSKITAKLYIDKNNDSKFDGVGEEVAVHSVTNGGFDTIVYSMPDDLTGVYFWKVVIEDSFGARDEYGNVFRLKGGEVKINVLQVCPSGNMVKLSEALKKAISGAGNTLGYRSGEYKINVTEISINEFNNPSYGDPYGIHNLNGTYDMIIFGFDDEYSFNDLDADAAIRLESFITTGQSVMFTHDTIEWSGYRSSVMLSSFRDDVGQTAAETATQIVRQYTNGTAISSTYGLNTSGYSNLAPNVYDKDGVKGTTHVKLVNSTQLSLYPFNLEKTAPENTSVANTHYQYYKLDLEDPDVVPVYNYYRHDVTGRVLDDSMNSYYTYFNGTITYSGTGHSAVDSNANLFELELFVNTIMKAYTGANHAPTIIVFTPQNNAVIDMSKDTFALSFKGSDFDFGDTVLNYKVTLIDTNGTSHEVTSGTMINSETKLISIDKSKYGISSTESGEFKVIVEVWDDSNAKSVKELTLVNSEVPKVTPILSVLPASGVYLVGDTVGIDVGVSASGKGIQTIIPAITLELPAGLTGGNVTDYFNYSDKSFDFTELGPVTASYIYDTKQITLANAGAYTLTSKCDYEGAATQTASAGIIVKSATAVFDIKDDKGLAIEGAVIKQNNINENKTDPGGACTFTDVPRGNNTYTINVTDGYIIKQLTATSTAADGTVNKVTSTSESITIPVSSDNYDWKIVCELEPDSGSVSAQVNDEQGHALSGVQIMYGDGAGGSTGSDGSLTLSDVPAGDNVFTVTPPAGYVLEKITATSAGSNPQTITSATASITLPIDSGSNDWHLSCIFKLIIRPEITYYKLEPDGKLSPLTPIKDNQGNITGYNLDAKKGTDVKIVALFTLPAMGGTGVDNLNITATLPDGVRLLSASEVPGGIWSGTAPAYIGSNKVSQSYFSVIDISKANNQQFSIDSVNVHMTNGSTYIFQSDNGCAISVKEFAPPDLR
jgi:hypothetical protein